MRCFYHQDKEAVGLCKSCAKALCAECAVDLGTALACRNRCEERARAIAQVQDRGIQSLTPAPRTQLTTTSSRPSQATAAHSIRGSLAPKPSRPWWRFW